MNGDIVQVPDDWETYGFNAGQKYQVYFGFGGFRLKPKLDLTQKGFWLENDEELEVIGNVWENSDLLGE